MLPIRAAQVHGVFRGVRRWVSASAVCLPGDGCSTETGDEWQLALLDRVLGDAGWMQHGGSREVGGRWRRTPHAPALPRAAGSSGGGLARPAGEHEGPGRRAPAGGKLGDRATMRHAVEFHAADEVCLGFIPPINKSYRGFLTSCSEVLNLR